jgi:Domain of unknown function (DUF4112)
MRPSPREQRIAEQLAERAARELLPDGDARVRAGAVRALAPWAEKLVRVLDETLRIPGTDIHIGLDPIIGLILPGAGDAITGTGSIALLFLALRERVPTVAILRMVLNIAVDALLGMVPFLGDAFDLFFRSNRRNLAIIERYRDDPKAAPGFLDYALVVTGVGLAVLSVALPIAIVYGVFAWLLQTSR